jgi:bacterioferritin
MKGKKSIIEALNDVLTAELTAINQYFLHARMLENWGLTKLGKQEFAASLDEMKHADQVTKRILFLEGLPNVQKIGRVYIGQDIEELIDCDLKVEYEALPRLKKHIKLCEEEGDFVSRDLLQSILISEEEHVDWLETQKELIKRAGIQNYVQSHIEHNLNG